MPDAGQPMIGPTEYVLPSQRVTNAELGAEYPEWDMDRTSRRTGVESRGIANSSETARSMGTSAARVLIQRYGIPVDAIGGLIVCTQTPDYPLPPNSTLIHADLGLREDAPAFDISHACSGFIYGASLGTAVVREMAQGPVLLITGDTYSRLIAPDDRSTRTVFGDGAAATLIAKHDYPATWPLGLSVQATQFGTRGQDYARFLVPTGGAVDSSSRPPKIEMDGLGMLQFVTATIPDAVEALLDDADWRLEDVDLFVFHQASRVGLDALRTALSLPPERVYENFADTGNLVSASIPVCLSRAAEEGRLAARDKVVLAGFGVGLSWGVMCAEVVGR
jgi:3-oxoacyl-[acyl-carrier-protein] synthase-3